MPKKLSLQDQIARLAQSAVSVDSAAIEERASRARDRLSTRHTKEVNTLETKIQEWTVTAQADADKAREVLAEMGIDPDAEPASE